MRWLATFIVVALFGLNLWMPDSALGRRGSETTVHTHVTAASSWQGRRLAPLRFEDLEGRAVSTADLLGHPLLLVFERSVDW
jgi:cytochrome oxidase Cu insertion factor (SCO1/SenC/PrrC family)